MVFLINSTLYTVMSFSALFIAKAFFLQYFDGDFLTAVILFVFSVSALATMDTKRVIV